MKLETISQPNPALVPLLMLTIMLLLLFQTVIAIYEYDIVLPGCQKVCGEVLIFYPFGIGANCSLSPFYELSCKNTSNNGAPAPFLLNDIPVLGIDIYRGKIHVNHSITSTCSPQENGTIISNITNNWNLQNTPYWISQDNKFIVIGCDVLADISFGGDEKNRRQPSGCFTSGCDSADSIIKGFCSGTGCCETYLPSGIKDYQVNLQYYRCYNGSKQYNSSQCGYAALVENSAYGYNCITTDKLYKQLQMPLYLDWSVGNELCITAQANRSSYACVSENSLCLDSRNDLGYTCHCNHYYAYEINPYLKGGCPGISYSCGALEHFKPNTKCQLYMPYVIGLTIGLGFGTGISAILLYFLIIKRLKLFQKRKQEKLRKKFFDQNQGYLLQLRIDSDEDATQRMRIFSLDELEKATNKFDNALILGHGGHGELYKGILSDQRVVAIKRSKIVDQSEIEQFINEVVILSQVNHRNIVKLYECCLETEVPLLVYEFISNGTLFNHLHVESCSLTWKHRLRIALEAARAVAYLHSSASILVFHRDIKSTNILVDDYFTAKVSDFGVSRFVQIDQTGITTVVQGIFGYLDPEYFCTSRLTPKSDVYSFGVILVELLTKEKPNSNFTLFEGGSLIVYFTSAMRENRLFEILDPQITMNEKQRTELEGVANLAEMCVRIKGEERPTMKEVETQLEVIWRTNQQNEHLCSSSQNLVEMQLPLHDSPAENGTTRQYSFEQEQLSSSNIPR